MTTAARRWMLSAASMGLLGGAQRCAGLLTMTVLARNLDAKQLGAYAFSQSTSQTAYGMARLGAEAGLQVSLARLVLPYERSQAQRLICEGFAVFLLIAFVGAAVLWTLAPLTASLFGAAELSDFVRPAAVLFFGHTLTQFTYGVFAGLNSFAAYTRPAIISSLLTAILVSLSGLLGGALAAAWALAGAQVLAAVFLAYRLSELLQTHCIRLSFCVPRRMALQILAIGLPFYASGLMLIPVEFLNLALLSRTAGIGILGDLRVTQALLTLAATLPTAMSGPLVTMLAGSSSDGTGRPPVIVNFRRIWCLALTTAVLFAIGWPTAIRTIFGPNYLEAERVGSLALLAFVFTMLFMVLQSALVARQATRSVFFVGIVQAVVLAGVAAPCIARFSLAGFFIAQVASACFASLLAFVVLRPDDNISSSGVNLGWLAGLTIVLAAFAIADWTFVSSDDIRLLACSGTILATFVLVVTKGINHEEKFRLAHFGAMLIAGVRTRYRKLAGLQG